MTSCPPSGNAQLYLTGWQSATRYNCFRASAFPLTVARANGDNCACSVAARIKPRRATDANGIYLCKAFHLPCVISCRGK